MPLLNDPRLRMGWYPEPELFMADLMKEADPDKISSAIAEQVALVGSQGLYERIHDNFKKLKFEAVLAKEQFDLFRWRQEYFHTQFPYLTWFTHGYDDSHNMDVVEYQITQKFDEVMAVACSPRPSDSRKVYFDNEESISSMAQARYDSSWVIYQLKELPITYFSHFTYPDALHIIMAGFQSEPLSLKYLAMKKVLVLNLEVEDLPQVLQAKAEKGLFTTSDQILPFINEEGKRTLEMVKSKFAEKGI